MKTYHECLPCFVTAALNTLKRACASDALIQRVMRAVFKDLSGISFAATPPVMSMMIYRRIRKAMRAKDAFLAEKNAYNTFALKYLAASRKDVEKTADVFTAKVKLAIAGNIIDFGKNGDLREKDVARCLDGALGTPLDARAVRRLRDAINKAGSILYLCDNAGEIVFDRFLIEDLPVGKITCAVRGKPVLNDAIMKDARQAGLTKIVTVVSNGSDAPGTILGECSPAFRARFEKADLVIAKGQGNFETLSEVRHKRIFFLLQIKCPVIARDSGFPVGTFVIKEINGKDRSKYAGSKKRNTFWKEGNVCRMKMERDSKPVRGRAVWEAPGQGPAANAYVQNAETGYPTTGRSPATKEPARRAVPRSTGRCKGAL